MPVGEPPGKLIGVGRSADVYALGTDRVLRRYRGRVDARPEAEVMAYLHESGFPVPKVYDADGTDLVMERLDGRDMLADLGRRPWLVHRHARTLASLHNRLHRIQAPPGLAAWIGPGERVVHRDLHPANVMLTSRGPVVIDWTGARSGAGGADVAMAYVIMASSEVDQVPTLVRPLVRSVRAGLISEFLASASEDPQPYLAEVIPDRLQDPNVRPSEILWLQRRAEELEQNPA